jgi:UDPglucose 6-dehydrogenase
MNTAYVPDEPVDFRMGRRAPPPTIGFIGLGFVGGAILTAVQKNTVCKTTILDPQKGYTATYQDLLATDAVFVAVPSPQLPTGACDTSILASVLEQLQRTGYTGPVISKTTAPPQFYTEWSIRMPNLVHAPEFLTAARAVEDYQTGTFAFIGSVDPESRERAERIITLTQPQLKTVHYCTPGEAALAKYTINTFLATKVAVMNEIYQLAGALGLNYKTISDMVKSDARIGSTHLQVPGPDGLPGYGGACFPKDTKAMLHFAESVGIDLEVLRAAVRYNAKIREE